MSFESRDEYNFYERQDQRSETPTTSSVSSYVLKLKSKRSLRSIEKDAADSSLLSSTLVAEEKNKQSKPFDSRNDPSVDKRQDQGSETRATSTVSKYIAKSKSSQSYRSIKKNADDSTLLSSTLATEEKNKLSKKQQYSKGIKTAVTIIVGYFEFAVKGTTISDGQFDVVLASMLCGEIVTSTCPKGKKALLKATQIDIDFVGIAIDTCRKTQDLGGGREEMECAVASVLACRGLRKYSNCKFNETTIDKMSDFIALETMGMMKEEIESDNISQNDKSLSSDANIPKK